MVGTQAAGRRLWARLLVPDVAGAYAGPCQGVRAPTDDNGARPARILTPEEVMLIMAAAEADDRRLGRSLGAPLVGLLFGTGLRLGEALALPWGAEGLDLEAGVVRVRRSLDRVRGPRAGAFSLVAPKTRTSRREVPLRPTDAAMLRRHRIATSRPPDGAFVFADERGGALPSSGRPRHAFKRAARGAGLADPPPKLHDLRHAYASALLAAGLTVHAVAELLGHSSPALVMARYGHAYADEVAASAMALERLVAARACPERHRRGPAAWSIVGPILVQSGGRCQFLSFRDGRAASTKNARVLQAICANPLSSAYGI